MFVRVQELPLVAVGCVDGMVYLVNVARGVAVAKGKLFEGAVECLRFSPPICRESFGDMLLAGADTLGAIVISPVSTLEARHTMQHAPTATVVTSLEWSNTKSNLVLLSAGDDGYIR